MGRAEDEEGAMVEVGLADIDVDCEENEEELAVVGPRGEGDGPGRWLLEYWFG